MLIAAVIFSGYPSATRLGYVKDFYHAISNHEISLATPILAGVRTPTKQYSSCVLMKAGDSRNSLFATNTAMGYAVTEKSGIGLGIGDIRAKGSSVRGGEYQHTGVIGFMKMYEATLNACSQGGLRKGSATVFYPFWHKDSESFLVLKNIKGTEENRVRKVDFAIGLSKIFYERVIRKQNLTLFDPNQVPQLKASFGLPEFDALYIEAENNLALNKTIVSATEFFATLLTERAETGRYYIYNTDHFNQHSSFTEQLTQSNLCVAPETKILTSKGHQTISELQDKVVTIWNGEDWSETTVLKTSSKSELIR
jgi:ribonucleoside-diphosphate reductase alpha chain